MEGNNTGKDEGRCSKTETADGQGSGPEPYREMVGQKERKKKKKDGFYLVEDRPE